MFNLIRDPKRVISNFKKLDGKFVCLKECKVIFPVNFEEYHLAEDIGNKNLVCGNVAVIVGDAYGVLTVNAMIEFSPTEFTIEKYNNEPYYVFSFDAGSIVINSTSVIKQDTLTYYIYNVFISKGGIPWYYNYKDMCYLFSTAKEYADANVGDRPEVIALMISLISRSESDRTKYYRQVVDSQEGNKDLVFIPIKSVEYGATNTINKLGGNYFQTGVVSALNSKSETVENIESILRG